MIPFFQDKYLDKPLSQGFISIYIAKAIIAIASALLGIFLPIFLYELFGQNFVAVVVYFGVGSLLYGLTVANGAVFLNKIGFRRALRISVFFCAAFYGLFYFINQDNLIYLIPATLIILTFYRLSYWVPYHTNVAKFTDKKNRGRQLSILNATCLIIGIFIPFIAGIIITQFSFSILFIIAMILHLISGIPYLVMPSTNETFSWTWRETWEQFLVKGRRKMMLAYVADGAESVIGLIIWPIFIYQLLKGSYFQVGAISTLIIGITAVLQLFLGKLIDSGVKKEKVLKWGSIFYSLGWVVKVFIATAFHIFVVGVYHNITRVFVRTPFDTLTYEIAADGGHYVDELTVLREMAIQFGKVLMIILVIITSFYLPIQWLFVLAALAAILFNLLNGQKMEQFDYRA